MSITILDLQRIIQTRPSSLKESEAMKRELCANLRVWSEAPMHFDSGNGLILNQDWISVFLSKYKGLEVKEFSFHGGVLIEIQVPELSLIWQRGFADANKERAFLAFTEYLLVTLQTGMTQAQVKTDPIQKPVRQPINTQTEQVSRNEHLPQSEAAQFAMNKLDERLAGRNSAESEQIKYSFYEKRANYYAT